MKKFIFFIVLIISLVVVYLNKTKIYNFIIYNFVIDTNIDIKPSNEYYLNYNFIDNNTDYIVNSKDEFIPIIYNILNNGWDKFSFYCDLDYKDCTKDLNNIINDDYILNDINNLVHPFNSFKNIDVSYSNFGEIYITIEKLYKDEEISIINKKVDEIINKLTSKDSDKDKIKDIHDYIINNTKYDTKKADHIADPKVEDSKYKSNIAYGPLIEGYGICSGYTDLMAIFLDRLNIPNYKLNTDEHTWNYVKLNNKWLHLDLTWDDPISDKRDFLLYDIFLVTDEELLKADKDNHNYKDNIIIIKN